MPVGLPTAMPSPVYLLKGTLCLFYNEKDQVAKTWSFLSSVPYYVGSTDSGGSSAADWRIAIGVE